MRERLASFISGGGSTMERVVTACLTGEVGMDVACIIASTPEAGGIEKAKKLDIPSQDIIVVDPHTFRNSDGKIDRETLGSHIVALLLERGVTVVTLNGWLPLMPELVIKSFPNSMFNQHPGPVPEFGGRGMYGRRVHAARLLFARKVKRDFWTEAIAQRLHAEYDQGAVVKSERVEIYPDDAVESLQQRVLSAEHRVQLALLQDVVAQTVAVVPRRKTLVRPSEIPVLLEAKAEAKRLYPQG